MPMADRFFITTAIDYTNGAPHLGHAYEKILADVISRYHRLKGTPVFFLTGVDQHGQKVQQSAEKEGVAPQEFVDRITGKFTDLWEKLDLRYDGWAATTADRHKSCVQQILQRLWDEGQIYKDKQGGHYSIRQEQFLTDKERGPDGEFGAEWGQVEFREEENYYFKLAQHRDWLLALIDERDDLILPSFRRGELRNAVERLAGDLCISRPKSRLEWGIEVPFDREFVTFVWFDALVNYLSFAPGYNPSKDADLNEFREWWPPLHVIGKDILIPAHGVYWLIMLHALGFSNAEMPRLLIHGFWNYAGGKMSKSLGNSIDPSELADRYSAEALRYYLMSEISTGKDSDFSEERLVMRYNTDLANSLGNLLNRTLNMAKKYREGKLAKFHHPGGANLEALVNHMVEQYRNRFEGVLTGQDGGKERTDSYQINTALAAAFDLVNHCNQFIDSEKPWALAKDPAESDRLDAVLYHLADSLRILAILLSPVMPAAALRILEQLACSEAPRLQDAAWGGLGDGHVLGTATPLFPRIEPTAPVA